VRCRKITVARLIDQSKCFTVLNMHLTSRAFTEIAVKVVDGEEILAFVLFAVRTTAGSKQTE
jgi:hypothetical protein